MGDAGYLKSDASEKTLSKRSRNFWMITGLTTLAIVVFGYMMNAGMIGLSLEEIAQFLGTSVALLAVLFFAYLINGTKSMLPVLLVAAGGFIVA